MAGGLRRLAAAAIVCVSFAVSTVPAGAVGIVVGFTWYSDGTFVRTAPSGTSITAFASGARPGRQYRLMYAPTRPSGEPCPDLGKVNVNPNVRQASAAGVIGNTSGPVVGPPGDYHVCFYELGAISVTATAPVLFTIV